MTYSQNIERLRSRSRANANRQIAQNIESANREGQTGIRQANQIASSLSDFSGTLHKNGSSSKRRGISRR